MHRRCLTCWQLVLALALQCGPVWCNDVAGGSLGQPRHPEVAGQAEAAWACACARRRCVDTTALQVVSRNITGPPLKDSLLGSVTADIPPAWMHSVRPGCDNVTHTRTATARLAAGTVQS